MSKLITLDYFKQYINERDTSRDVFYDAAVDAASSLVAETVGCDIILTTYNNETYVGDGHKTLRLNNWPLSYVDRISVGRLAPVKVMYTGDGQLATVSVTANAVRIRHCVDGVWSTNSFALSDYNTISLIGSAVEGVSGWDWTVNGDYDSYPAADLLPYPAQNAADTYAYLYAPDSCIYDYEIVDADKAILYRSLGWDLWTAAEARNNICVTYTAGYSLDDMPQTIKSATAEMAKLLVDIAQRDGSLSAEKAGDWSWDAANWKEMQVPGLLTLKLRALMRDEFGVV